MRILFITATRLGDAVLSTGLLAHLLAQYPDARVTVACGPVAEGVFARMPGLDRVVVVDKRRFDLHWPLLWARVAWVAWDIVVDLRGSALSLALRARRRTIMRGGRRAGHRLTHMAKAAGVAAPLSPVAWTAPADRAAAGRLLPEDGPILGLGPTANWSGKMWPADRFVALAHALADTLPGIRIAVFGGPGAGERQRAAATLAALPAAIDLVGKLDVAQAAACLARCTLFVGNDSGLMHLAAAAGAATLGLFGPSQADEYAPVGRCAAFVEASGPRGSSPMTSLPVEAAVAAALGLLRREGFATGAPVNTPAGIAPG